MQSNILETLEKKLSPATSGLIWFSETSLEKRPLPFEELDYFLDGLLSQTAELSSQQESEHYFIKASQFSRPFYLIYLGPHQSSHKLTELIQQDLNLMGDCAESEVLLINAPSHINTKSLAQKLKLKINNLKIESK